jgi:hypothetical protein
MSAIARRSQSDRAVLVVLGFAVVAEIAFLLAIPRYVTVDGATHVGGAALLRDVLEGAGELHLRYVDVVPFPAPNLLPEIGLALAMLVLDPVAAEKLLQVVYVVVVPLALLYAVRSVRSGRDWIALLALPMTFTFAFQFGFYDFSFGVALFLVAAGYAWRHRDAPRRRVATMFGLLAILLYLTHVVAYAELVVFIGVVGAWRILRAGRVGGSRTAAAAARSMLPVLVAALPSIALAAVFFLATATATPAEFLPILLQAIGVLGLALGLVTTDRLEVLVAVGLALSLAGLLMAAVRVRARAGTHALDDDDALLAYAVVALAIAIVAPASVRSGGSYIPERLALFPVYGLALWLAAMEMPRWTLRIAAPAWLAVAAALLLLRLPTTLGLSAAAVEYESIAPCLALRSTMIQVNLALLPAGSLARTDPFTSETGRIAAATQSHDITHFEGALPFFVFRNRPTNDPYRWLFTRPVYRLPPGVDLAAFGTRPAGIVDYVLVVGRQNATPGTLAAPGWTSLRDELNVGYRRVAVSAHGLVEAWERVDATLASAGDGRRSTIDTCQGAATP